MSYKSADALNAAKRAELERVAETEAIVEIIDACSPLSDGSMQERNERLREILRRFALSAQVEEEKKLREAIVAQLMVEIESLFVNLGQLLQGWHADGTAWSEWDQSVYDELKRLHRIVYDRFIAQSNEAAVDLKTIVKALKSAREWIAAPHWVIDEIDEAIALLPTTQNDAADTEKENPS